MSVRGITLMALGALGTAALIGLNTHGTVATAVMVVAGIGTLAVFFAGSMALLQGRRDRAEGDRVDGLADDVQQEARVHLLEGREAQLVRRIDALELRRDEVLAETAAAAAAGSKTASKRGPHKPKLVMVASND